MDAITAGLVGAVVGGIITGTPAVLTFWIGKKSEERRQLRALAVNAAIENWKIIGERQKHSDGELAPLDTFIIHMVKFSELFLNEKMTVASVPRKFREIYAFIDAADIEIQKRSDLNNPR